MSFSRPVNEQQPTGATKFQSRLALLCLPDYACTDNAVRRMESGETPEQFALL
ncbi:MAG: hypothetical protein ACR2RV_21110 [Verrucomicrobiales bacterium]